MNKINLLYLVRPVAGGIKTHLINLCNGLEEEKYNIYLATPNIQDFIPHLPKQNVQLLSCGITGNLNLPLDYKVVHEIAHFLRQYHIQIIHTHGFKASLLGRIAARMVKTPIVITTAHNFIYNNLNNSITKLLVRNLQKKLATGTDHFIAVSQALAEDIIKNEGILPKKVTTIYNGIDTRIQRKRIILLENLIDPSFQNIVVIARLIPEKGVHLFIQMSKIIANLFPLARFYIIGDGPEKNNLKLQVKEYDLEEKIFFLGYRNDVADLLSQFKIVVIPSLNEGLSVTALEAMLAQRAIVASNVGGLPELIEHGKTGLLFSKGNVIEGANQIINLLNNKNLAAYLAHNALQKVLKNFSREKMCQETSEIYEHYYLVKKL
ncbi:glycosyltransferase [Bacillota bacterium LX-D]|nr:glycosyltransferase [Bacillota bacterium LX-D]